MPGSSKVNGAWRTTTGLFVKVGGQWRTATSAFIKVGGVWKQWYASRIEDTFTRSSTVTSLGTSESGQLWQNIRGTWRVSGSNTAVSDDTASSYPLAAVEINSSEFSVRLSTSGGTGLAFWVVDSNNWWAAVPRYTYSNGLYSSYVDILKNVSGSITSESLVVDHSSSSYTTINSISVTAKGSFIYVRAFSDALATTLLSIPFIDEPVSPNKGTKIGVIKAPSESQGSTVDNLYGVTIVDAQTFPTEYQSGLLLDELYCVSYTRKRKAGYKKFFADPQAVLVDVYLADITLQTNSAACGYVPPPPPPPTPPPPPPFECSSLNGTPCGYNNQGVYNCFGTCVGGCYSGNGTSCCTCSNGCSSNGTYNCDGVCSGQTCNAACGTPYYCNGNALYDSCGNNVNSCAIVCGCDNEPPTPPPTTPPPPPNCEEVACCPCSCGGVRTRNTCTGAVSGSCDPCTPTPPPSPPPTPPPPPQTSCAGVSCPTCYACFLGFCEFEGCPTPPPPPPTPPPTPPPPPPPSGGGGCLVGSTLVSTPNGYVQAKDITVGSVVHSIRFEELGTDETVYTLPEWTTDTLTPVELIETTITAVKVDKTVGVYLNLNGDLVTPEHPILVKSGDTYSFKQAGDIQLGDLVLRRGGDTVEDLVWEPVVTNDVVEETVDVYLFDAEDQDVLFTQNFLSHNLKAI